MATATNTQKKTTDATSKVQLNVDRSTKALEKIVTDLNGVFNQVQSAKDTLLDTVDQVQVKQLELEGLTAQFDEAFDQKSYELRIKVRDNKEQTLKALLTEFGLSHISSEDLQALKQELTHANRDIQTELENVRSEVQKEWAAKLKTETDALNAKHAIEVAQYQSQINSLSYKVEVLESSVESLKDAANAEREARVEIAKADSQKQGVTVNTSKS